MIDFRLFRLLVCLVILFSGRCVKATPLSELVEAAMSRDGRVRAAKQQVEAAVGKIDQAQARFLPTVNLSANAAMNDQNIAYVGASSTRTDRFGTHGAEIRVTQPLIRVTNNALFDQSLAEWNQALAQLNQSEAELRVRVGQIWLEALQAMAESKAVSAEINYLRSFSQAMTHRWRNDSATDAEHMEVISRLNVAKSREFAAQMQLESAIFSLRQVTGLQIREKDVILEPLVQMEEIGLAEQWIERALAKNSQIQAQSASRDSAKAALAHAEAQHYPTLDLVGTRSHNRQGPSATLSTATDVDVTSLGLQLNIPLYTGGAITGQVREAAGLLGKSEAELDALRQDVIRQVVQIHHTLRFSLIQIGALEESQAALAELVVSARKGAKVGVRTETDVLELEQRRAAVERDAMNARSTAFLNWLKLQFFAGGAKPVSGPER